MIHEPSNVNYIKRFKKEWDTATQRLKNSRTDLSRIVFIAKVDSERFYGNRKY